MSPSVRTDVKMTAKYGGCGVCAGKVIYAPIAAQRGVEGLRAFAQPLSNVGLDANAATESNKEERQIQATVQATEATGSGLLSCRYDIIKDYLIS